MNPKMTDMEWCRCSVFELSNTKTTENIKSNIEKGYTFETQASLRKIRIGQANVTQPKNNQSISIRTPKGDE